MRTFLTAVLFTGLFACLPAPLALAHRYGDVDVSQIPGESAGTQHGYASYRFRVKNEGQAPAKVRLTLGSGNGFGGGLAQLRREVEVPAHAGLEMVLHQPAEVFYAREAAVAIDGATQEDRLPVSGLDHGRLRYGGSEERFLLTSNRLALGERDGLTFSKVAASGVSATASAASMRDAFTNVTAVLPVAEWPGDWLSFSRWDAVALTRDEFESAPPAVRAALADWARAGGRLLILRAGAKDVPAEWKAEAQSDADDAGSLACRVGLGRVVFVPKGTERAAGQAAFRDANDARHPALRTPDCAAVATGQVSVRGMFLLMLVFAALVGPVNYIFCARRNKRIWMLWTSPAIAGVFVAAVFGYALLSDGIRPWGRTVAVTLLDEKNHLAVTLGTTAWYAPMLPSEGLRFGAATEVRALGGAETNRMSWSDPRGERTGLGVVHGGDQRLTGGWMVPRYPDSFGYRKVAGSRLRMRFEKDAAGAWWAVNGLGADIDSLEVRGPRLLHCAAIPAGGRARLEEGPGRMDLDPSLTDAPAGSTGRWQAQLSTPLFAEIPFDRFKSHEVAETVGGGMEETIR